ncbi:MAG: D-2-hydroxyacid dehydrogenase [Acidobacteriota bacterium]|nr:D-2-hydroxyacid dehydrogenase [Acidobacteriota bacterium]
MKVVITHRIGPGFIEELREIFPEVEFRTAYTPEEQLREVPDAEVQFGLITEEVLEAARKLRWFHFVGIGFDHILTRAPGLVESDVVMTNARETHVIAMADHALAMILAFAHRVPDLLEDQRARNWDTIKYFGAMTELAGTTLGILAMGDIGKGVAQRAAGFDMEVYGVDVVPMEPPPGVREVWGVERLDEMLAISDWFVVTAPLVESTRGLIDAGRLAHLKRGAHLIVVSRGGIVDEDALAEAIRSGRLGGAALDATDPEPPVPESPLWDLPNVIISPHVSADSPQMWQRRREIFIENLRRYLAGKPLKFVCDKARGY